MAEKIFRIDGIVSPHSFIRRVDRYVWDEMEKVGEDLDSGLKETGYFGGGSSNKIDMYADMIAYGVEMGDTCVILYGDNVSPHSKELFVNELANTLRLKRGLDSQS